MPCWSEEELNESNSAVLKLDSKSVQGRFDLVRGTAEVAFGTESLGGLDRNMNNYYRSTNQIWSL